MEFDGKYFLPDVRKTKKSDFQILKQGPMSVAQYEAQFRALERFALNLLPTKRRRV